MKIDLLVAEIGSTTTVVNAFNDLDTCPKFIGQGQSATSVLEGDVNIGLKGAIDDLAKNLGEESIDYDELIATSSAAGGLRMTVHGLVYDMTVKAAKEAALGAGANIKFITAGRLRKSDLRKIEEIKPNIILIAGGVDYGERDTALYNSELIAELNLNIPVIYAGNIENHEDVKDAFEGKQTELYIVDNVYPKIDELNVEPTRKVIQEVFEKHIIHAPGMERVREMVTGPIMPTPGAVMAASQLLYDDIGDLVTIDVGGATTDVHSVTEDSDEISRILINPEPKAKRTVEGDLGVYVSMKNVVEMVGKEELVKELQITMEELEDLIAHHKPIPETDLEKQFVEKLTLHATITAVRRHAGGLKHLYGPSGKKTIAEGKDLTQVKYIIGTGGALTRLPNRKMILGEIALSNKGNDLLPNAEAEILIDNHYIMASLGVMAKKYPEEALRLLENSLKGE
ncbi:DNA mismatch repair protein MutL [Tissierella sp. P1]|uniref:GlmL-related ornithine degradation protein n=1 Tax=Tissierella carlieri TaxID=689904 RepID=A0ABT1SBK3_9FIRM|nr:MULTISPECIES: GlmL-related ornithine degradation protein [Tissierella]MCQ4923869.1 GlmL-related ornithine degradation protein [Tissierella carlieri]OZV12422.1 DNA mismatch repair protein MutL [Tissierella sp. P1]